MGCATRLSSWVLAPLRAKGWHNQVEQVYVGVYVLMSVTEVSKTCT